jgi:hypothetical protein
MKRVLFSIILILAATVIASAQSSFYYAHILDGVQQPQNISWKATILLTNPSTSSASGTIAFTKDTSNLGLAGSPWTLTLTDETGSSSTASVFNVTLGPGQTHKYVSSGSGTYTTGFATVTGTGAINGTAIYSGFDSGGNLIGEAGVAAGSAVTKQSVFVDTQNGYLIGVAIANPGNSAASMNLTLLNASAATVASTTQTLGPGNHTAALTSGFFPSAGPLAGTMQIVSNTPLAAIAFRLDPTGTKFTTLPPVTLASLINPAIEWLQERPWLTPLSSMARLLGSLQFRLG